MTSKEHRMTSLGTRRWIEARSWHAIWLGIRKRAWGFVWVLLWKPDEVVSARIVERPDDDGA